MIEISVRDEQEDMTSPTIHCVSHARVDRDQSVCGYNLCEALFIVYTVCIGYGVYPSSF